MRHTALLLAIFALLVPAARGQDTAPPGPQETYDAYMTVDTWIRRWDVPVERRAMDPARTRSACVTLRFSGKVIGRGTHVSSEGDAVWAATRQAWLEAQSRLPVPNDATRNEEIRRIAPLVMIDLQLGGANLPMLGETFVDASLDVSPGLSGVSARAGDRRAAIFPGTMLALNFTPELALRAAAGELDLPPKELGALRADHGVSVARFRAIHLAQAKPGAPPMFLSRGSKLVPATDVSGPNLREAAVAMAHHLMSHAWPGPEPHGMSGDYVSTTGRYDPPIASPRVQAIAAFALLRFAETPGIEHGIATRAEIFARDLLSELTDVTQSEQNPLDNPVDAAAWLLADEHARESDLYESVTAEFRGAAQQLVLDAVRDRAALRRTVSPAERALIAAAVATISGTGESPPQAESLARELTVELYRETPEGEVVSLMPWLAIASSELKGAEAAYVGAGAVRSSRESVWAHQISADELGVEESDLAGGIVFTRGRNPLPTWHSLRPLAFVAMTLGEPAVTDGDEFLEQFANLARSLRFVLQLAVREPDLHMMQNPDRALGGVRLSTWDARVSVDATSLGLLTVSETLRAVEHASNR